MSRKRLRAGARVWVSGRGALAGVTLAMLPAAALAQSKPAGASASPASVSPAAEPPMNQATTALPPGPEPGTGRGRVVTLAEAVRTAKERQPQLAQARANVDSARARADELRSVILPQLTLTAGYQRTTANFVARPGSVPAQFMASQGASGNTFNFWTGALTLNQYIWDFGQTTGRWKAARATAEATAETGHAVELQVAATVRSSYFLAHAQKALIQVARDNLKNQERHLAQVQGFVEAGTRPGIDLAQARADRANARVQLISAQNNYELAKAQLNQAMGVEASTDFDVGDETLVEVAGENDGVDGLTDEAQKARPEIASLDRQIRAQEYTLSSVKGGYGPTLGATMNVSEAGVDITNLTWNWAAAVNLTWPLFQGLLTYSQVKEARANIASLTAQKATLRSQVRLDVEQARLQVRSARETVLAAGDVVEAARERLRLAEGRYQSGVGSILELGDAQVAFATSAAQVVQAEYTLASARILLLRALGRGF